MIKPTYIDPPTTEYPDTDGLPMAEGTLQFRWIVTIKEGLEALFADDPSVFVAGDLFWYPVEGDNQTRAAPDTMVAFGRPKGERGSYRQWEEGGVAPQVVFEILSPSNRPGEMREKLGFYERFGVEEYYVYDPAHPRLEVWLRRGERLEPIEHGPTWVSPKLRIRFDLTGKEMAVFGPDGRLFLTPSEALRRADEERARADEERARADAQAAIVARLRTQLEAQGLDPDGV